MNYNNLLVETKEQISTITINRPKSLNALNQETVKELKNCLDDLKEAKNTKVLIITGSGTKAFIAGADITGFQGKTSVSIRDYVIELQEALNKIEDLPFPVIAKINGYCLGGGLELAMACDIRIASENAVLGQPEIKLGLIPGAGGTQRLSRIVGTGIAKELIFTGNNIDSKRAYDLKLVNKVFSQDLLDEETLKFAKQLVNGPTFALNMAKEAINRGTQMSLLDAIRMEAELFALCFSHEDVPEGVDAFLSKRKANFK